MIEGCLDVHKIKRVLNLLVKRHESLRTYFDLVEGMPVQKIHKYLKIEIEQTYAKNESINDIVKNFICPFNLDQAPLLRVGLVELAKDKNILMFDMHHIISDGTSVNILIRDFIDLYEDRLLPQLVLQYKDFSEWQNTFFESDIIREQEKYWLNLFRGDIPSLEIPTDFARSSERSFAGKRIKFCIDSSTTKILNSLALENRTTLYMVLLAVYNILLSKYTGQEDIIVGSPISGRHRGEVGNIIGMFINTLALRNHPEKDMHFRDFLGTVRENTLNAYKNQDYQFDTLVDKLNIRRDMSRNPLFDTMFALQNINIQELQVSGLSITPIDINEGTCKFDLYLEAIEIGGKLYFEFEYCTELFTEETINRMASNLINTIKEITRNPGIKISEIEIISEKEKMRLLYEFNNTCADYPQDNTIIKLFEKQVEKSPDSVALKYMDKSVTYRELNRKSNILANLLRQKGGVKDKIIALAVERSIEMIIGILGILKAGAAYLPIDPLYPQERKIYMLEDSKTSILLTLGDMEAIGGFVGDTIKLDDERLYEGEGDNLLHINSPRDLAYIIYTSGTTGKPKGVMIEHRNVVRLLFNNKMQFDFNEKDVWTLFHSYSFDFSVWEIFGALLYGGKLVIVPWMTARNPKEYLKLLKEEGVTVLNQTPTAFYRLADEESKDAGSKLSLRYVIFGGEALKPVMLKEWRRKYPAMKLVNMYGITETTVHVTYKEITETEIESDVSNIGKPIPTLVTYILDKNMMLVPMGAAGELCVGGEGVGRGYLNRPELTSEKFVENPYKPEERLYRSGDFVRLLPNGEMEYLGRIDQQVKIRGHRIELGEVENRLMGLEDIKEAVAVVKENESGDRYISAYYVSEKEHCVKELREYLSRELPEYMIPAYFVRLDKIPLTSNGKIDRKALPEPQDNIHTGMEFVTPETNAQKVIAQIWKDVLKLEKVGIYDNFFELGGNSLLLVRAANELDRRYPGKIRIVDFFSFPTISALSSLVECVAGNAGHNVKLRPISLPPEFFNRTGEADEDSLLRIRLSNTLYESLKTAPERLGTDTTTILLSAFIFLLSEISGCDDISLPVILDEHNLFFVLDIALKGMVDIRWVIQNVDEKYRQLSLNKLDLNKDRVIVSGKQPEQEEDDCGIILLFCINSTLDDRFYSKFDIVFKVDDDGSIAFSCWYNAVKIKGDKVKGLLYGYMKILDIILKNLLLEDE